MSDTKYLIKRYQTWYLQLLIPKQLRPLYNQTKIVVSLQTADLKEARLRRDIRVGLYKSEFQTRLRQVANLAHPTPDNILEALKHKKEIDLGLREVNTVSPSGSSETIFSNEPGNHISSIETVKQLGQYNLASQISSSMTTVTLISRALAEHIEEVSTYIRKQTRNTRNKRVTTFINWVGDKEVSRVSKRNAADFVTKRVMKLDLAIKTKKCYIGDLSAFFTWCKDRHYCLDNPFSGLTKGIKGTTRGTREKTSSKRRAFTDEELLTVFKAIINHRGTDSNLWPYTLIALFSGMRSSEIANTELIDVYENHIHIPVAKTESSIRDVPIHEIISPLILRLKETSKDGYLLSNLRSGGVDNKRNHYIVKNFGNLLRNRAGIKDTQVVFHCLRKNFLTALEVAGVPEPTAKLIAGHARQSMTYGVYSKGVELSALQEAVNKVSYNKELINLITENLIKF